MSSVSRPVSGQTPMRGMIEEQSVQSASVKGSMLSSESVFDASNMSSVSIVKEGSESSGMSELVDRMLKYQPPPNLTAEMGETVDDEIKYMKSTAELLSFRRNLVKIDNFRRKLVKLRRTPFLKMCHFRRKLVKLRRTSYLKMCHVRRQLVTICESW